MKRIIGIIFLIALLAGCATFPPPRIENGEYINEEHGISVGIPQGWTASTDLPRWVKQFPGFQENNFNVGLYLYNKEEAAWMFLALEKYSLFSYHPVMKDSFYNGTWKGTLDNMPPEVKIDYRRDRTPDMLMTGMMHYDAVDYFIAIRSGIYGCGKSLCAYVMNVMQQSGRGKFNIDSVRISIK